MQFIEFFREPGLFFLDIILVPLLIWTLFALVAEFVLRSLKNIHHRYQYHVRIALISTLPLGILVNLISKNLLINITSPLFTPALFEFTLPAIAVSGTPGFVDSGIFDMGITGWTGLIFLGIAAISLVRTTALWLRYMLITRRQAVRNSSIVDPASILSANNLRYLQSLNIDIQILSKPGKFVPYTFGCIKPVIVMPESIVNNSRHANLTLLHELIHIHHKDHLLNSLAHSIEALFWFHPLVSYVRQTAEEELECACDQHIISFNEIHTKTYAKLLTTVANWDVTDSSISAHMSTTSSNLKKRINAMAQSSQSTFSGTFSLLICGILLSIGLMAISCSDVQQDSMNDTAPQEAQKANDKVFKEVNGQMPSMKGGLASLQSKIQYPEQAKDEGIETRVMVRVVVDDQGEVETSEVLKNDAEGYGFEQAALSAVNKLEFEPGIHNGKPVKTQLVLPIVFRL